MFGRGRHKNVSISFLGIEPTQSLTKYQAMAPAKSLALVGTAPGVVAVKEVATPTISKPNEIIVKVSKIGHVISPPNQPL
jgi:hypothetical protein